MKTPKKKSAAAKDCMNTLNTECIHTYFDICLFAAQDERKMCNSSPFSIALLLNFIDISFLPRAKKRAQQRMRIKHNEIQ